MRDIMMAGRMPIRKCILRISAKNGESDRLSNYSYLKA